MKGIHIIGDLTEVDFSQIQLDKIFIKNFFSDLIKSNFLTELGNYYHNFGNKNELTGVIALAESHITFHTWPEFGYVSFDIFVCNLKNDNSKKAQKIFEQIVEFFNPGKIEKKVIERGI